MRAAVAVGSLALLFLAAPASAQSEELARAEKQLADGEAELAAAGNVCVNMCKALQSMMNAADRICDLAKDGPPEDQKRCADARSKVAEALARVRATCPECNPGPPLAPSATPPKTHADEATPMAGAGAAPVPVSEETVAYRSESRRVSPRVTVTIDPLKLFLPAFLVQLRFEKAMTEHFSVALAGAYGSLPVQGGNGPGRNSATMIGAEFRGYVAGRVDGFGVFVAGEINHRNAALFAEDHIATPGFVLGLTAGPLVGVKMVTVGGFTFESRVGASYVIDDKRWAGEPRPKIVPNFGVGIGFTL